MTPMPPPSLGFQEGVAQPLEKKYEVIKDVGDGSFGSVVLARIRGTRNTVAIKSMKKSFDSFSECLRLREVQSLRAIPQHPHIVPVLDAFLDPITHKLHLVMELMEINLYQFLKSRENKPLDTRTVQVILWQVMSALQHIHAHGFFHRDIKPENVLLSVLTPQTTTPSQRSLFTPPATPPTKSQASTYLVKLADFGLAREIRSRPPYTSYVSTRWYRAPEVLLRAEEYSAPVDIWAMGAMAIEVATLRPIFPGTNEIDQLWRVCEVMGTPGEWFATEERTQRKLRIGGGSWSHGLKLAHNLSFKFPNVAPMDMTTILTPPWPKSLSEFVVACLSWDPRKRPTSVQCLNHEYFKDVERYLPLREMMPAPPALYPNSQPTVQRKPSLKGLGIDISQGPRGARQQPSYNPIPTQTYPQELTHHQSQPQLQQKGGWFRKEKKRDSQPPAQAPQLPQLNLGPPSYHTPPKVLTPGNGGMAFSPHKQRPSHERNPSYPREDHIINIPVPQPPPAPPPARPIDVPPPKISWASQIQVPGHTASKSEISRPLALPTIRPSSPLLGEVFESTFAKKVVKEGNGLESPKREKSPVRQPVVNTFLAQAQALEREEKRNWEEKQLTNSNTLSLGSPKIGRQLSSTSSVLPPKVSSPTSGSAEELEPDGSSSSTKNGFFSHFRKRARKRISVNGEDSLSPTSDKMPISPLPISPLPQIRQDKFRNSIMMDDFFEDAQEEIESDLMKDVLSGKLPRQHITIAPSPAKAISSQPPSSHKHGATIPQPQKATRHVPSPYPGNVDNPKVAPIQIPKRGSSRVIKAEPQSSNRRPNAPGPTIALVSEVKIPGAYPHSPDTPVRRGSIPLNRSNTNLSVNLPGAYPNEGRRASRYNSSSSGLSSAASYRTAFDPETWDSEEQKQREEQVMLQESLREATRAMRALEKHPFTDWTDRPRRGTQVERQDTIGTEGLMESPTAWPTPPYGDDPPSSAKVKQPRTTVQTGNGGLSRDMDYFRIGIPSPSNHR